MCTCFEMVTFTQKTMHLVKDETIPTIIINTHIIPDKDTILSPCLCCIKITPALYSCRTRFKPWFKNLEDMIWKIQNIIGATIL